MLVLQEAKDSWTPRSSWLGFQAQVGVHDPDLPQTQAFGDPINLPVPSVRGGVLRQKTWGGPGCSVPSTNSSLSSPKGISSRKGPHSFGKKDCPAR